MGQIFHKDIAVRNPYVERTLEFLAQFIALVTKSNESNDHTILDEDYPSHLLLTQVVFETLKVGKIYFKGISVYINFVLVS